MSKVIKDGGIVEDRTQILQEYESGRSTLEPHATYFLSLPQWLDAYPRFEGFASRPGLWLAGDDGIDGLQPRLADVPAIAIHFSRFSDGRGLSTAALLRDTHGFEGELRAFGDLIADQALQLRRCGFNVIALKQGECLETALAMLLEAGLTYQGSVYSPRTPFKFRF